MVPPNMLLTATEGTSPLAYDAPGAHARGVAQGSVGGGAASSMGDDDMAECSARGPTAAAAAAANWLGEPLAPVTIRPTDGTRNTVAAAPLLTAAAAVGSAAAALWWEAAGETHPFAAGEAATGSVLMSTSTS